MKTPVIISDKDWNSLYMPSKKNKKPGFRDGVPEHEAAPLPSGAQQKWTVAYKQYMEVIAPTYIKAVEAAELITGLDRVHLYVEMGEKQKDFPKLKGTAGESASGVGGDASIIAGKSNSGTGRIIESNRGPIKLDGGNIPISIDNFPKDNSGNLTLNGNHQSESNNRGVESTSLSGPKIQRSTKSRKNKIRARPHRKNR